MSHLSWPMLTPPRPLEVWRSWNWELREPADLTRYRRQLRLEALPADRDDADEAAVERLLLAFEELTSNGVRHGLPPVWTTVTATSTGWLIDVTDADPRDEPVPAIDRDPAHGGLGLHLIARLCAAHGWAPEDGRKHVWGFVSLTSED
ncbi:ATP-binding protein [Modestobacter roseus]|uniref:Histidine kinase-like protein n=1 Tax=Modestobacter roseus TaxID=1181884 RepID=A0A562ILG3_9ACTN|nr:ATP-binding protein [Modestobacter roseus]TWH71861.1 histidine kinase-like protein [Modestobacter roseus]